jgi:hypothetical protein
MKEGTAQFTQSQRTALLNLIACNYGGEIWNRARSKYDEIRDSLEESLIKEWVQKYSAKDLIDSVHQLRAQAAKAERDLEKARTAVSEAEASLAKVGFDLSDDGSVTLSRRAPGSIMSDLEKRLDKELGTKEQVLAKPFDLARLKLLTVATAEEAEKIVEPLLNFEVKAK